MRSRDPQSEKAKKKAPAPTEGAAALDVILGQPADRRKPVRVRVVPPQKASKSQPKADASEKTKSKDRDWLTTAELATKIGWREHALRDAMRGKDLPGVRRTSFGYHIESASVDEISKVLGAPPPKGNAPKRKAARL
jgi:hypothetical protein